jgi:hypothetical protein
MKPRIAEGIVDDQAKIDLAAFELRKQFGRAGAVKNQLDIGTLAAKGLQDAG